MIKASISKIVLVATVITLATAFPYQGVQLPYMRCDKHLINETKSFLTHSAPEMELRFMAANFIPYSLLSGDYVCGPAYQMIVEASRILKAKYDSHMQETS